MLKSSKIKFATLFFTIFVLTSFQLVSALSLGGISGKPAGNPYSSIGRSWFVYTLEPGSEVEDAVEVYNPTDSEKTISVYPADSTPSSEGGFALKQHAEEMTEVGSWITMDKTEVVIPAGGAELIPFKIKLPESGLDVGEHSGGIMIEGKQVAQSGAEGVILNTRVGLRVYITVPGDIIKKIDFDFLDYKVTKSRDYQLPFGLMPEKPFIKIPEAYDFKMGVINNGNVSTDVKYIFTVEDVFFNKYNQTIEKEQKTERDTATTTHFDWETPLFGKYRISVTAKYQGKDASMDSEKDSTLNSTVVELWIIPWDIIIAISFFVLAIIFLLLIRKAFKKKPKVKGKKAQKKKAKK